jgi:hypothetical protein
MIWDHHGQKMTAAWYSETNSPVPQKIVLIDDTMSAKQAIQMAQEHIGMLWDGDYQNARELLKAISRKLSKKPREGSQIKPQTSAEYFHLHRQEQAKKAQIMGQILVMLTKDFVIPLRRGQDVQEACQQVLGPMEENIVMPLKQLLAINSAYEWRKKGVRLSHFKYPIIPYFGVFSPLRGEYLDLVRDTPLPNHDAVAFDIGTGTGVLSILLADRGLKRIIATDNDSRAIACARENITNFQMGSCIELVETSEVFPQDRGLADLIICNPPWLPGEPSSSIENAIFDPNSQFLKRFLFEVSNFLNDQGQVWLILSDFAEHLGLRDRQELIGYFDQAGLVVLEKRDARPKHAKTFDTSDPLHFARAKETTSLWVLGK